MNSMKIIPLNGGSYLVRQIINCDFDSWIELSILSHDVSSEEIDEIVKDNFIPLNIREKMILIGTLSKDVREPFFSSEKNNHITSQGITERQMYNLCSYFDEEKRNKLLYTKK